MSKDELIYAVARVKFAESKLLTSGDISALVKLPSTNEAILYLKNLGWFDETTVQTSEVEALETKRLWQYLFELVPDKDKLAPLLLFNDYLNLKTILKSKYNGIEYENNLSAPTYYKDIDIHGALSSHSFDKLPIELQASAKAAYNALFTTGDGALAETIIDTAMLKHISSIANRLKVSDYVDKYITLTNVKVALRAVSYSKTKEYLEIALVPCKGIKINQLSSAALHGMDELYSTLNNLGFSGAVEVWKNNKADFDAFFSAQFYNHLKTYKYEVMGLMPIICYYYNRVKEIRAVRTILAGIDAGLDSKFILKKVFF